MILASNHATWGTGWKVKVVGILLPLCFGACSALEYEPERPQATRLYEDAEIEVIPINSAKETPVTWFLNPEVDNVGACTFHNQRKFGMLGQYLHSSQRGDFWKIRLRVPEGDDVEREFEYGGEPVVLYESAFERVEFRAVRMKDVEVVPE